MKEKKKEDLRVRRTKKLLSNALFDLIKKKPFDKVTVCDICDEAMVHRATFYSHFSDKYELLTYSIDEHLPMVISDISGDGSLPAGQSYKMVEDIIEYISDNKEIYTSIFKKNNCESISDRILNLFERKLLKIIKELANNGTVVLVKPEFWASFYAGACLNVVTKWLVGEMEMPKDELINNLNILLMASHNS